MHTEPLTTVAAAVILGVAGQTLASLARMPAIVFLLTLGVVAGPFGFHVVRPEDLGGGLPVLTSAFVAIILFEGALTLRPRHLGEVLTPVRCLITVGATVTLGGAAALAHFLIGLPWSLAFSFAALVVVTGPTVIAPILRRVRLRPRLHAVLKSESILIDPIGVFIAVVMFQYVVGLAPHQANWQDAVLGFLARLGIGTVVGGLAGLTGAVLVRWRFLHRGDSESLVALGALGLALGAYAAAEQLQAESGVMAVIVAGLILAAVRLPFREELEKFKDLLTTLGVSVLFVLLAANLDLHLLVLAGWREAALLAGLMFVVRPAAVFLSTLSTSLTWQEKTYLSLLAPRGILAAAMASYFAGQLRERGLDGANQVEMLVFLTVATTVFVQGSWAGLLARLLRVRTQRAEGVLLVGVNEWSLALAEALRRCGRLVVFMDSNVDGCEIARARGFAAHRGDATERETYEGLELSALGLLVAMTPNDAVNTLACEAAYAWLGKRGVMQVVGRPSGSAQRARVRMAGRWAMPTALSHRVIVTLLRRGSLRLAEESVVQPTEWSHEREAAQGCVVPLLVMQEGRVRIPVAGHACPAGAVVVGLAPHAREAEPTGKREQSPSAASPRELQA